MFDTETLAPAALLADIDDDALSGMDAAGREVAECQRVLAKTGDTVVEELLRGHGPTLDWQHYPPGDIFDPESHAQYYFHLHPAESRAPGEHGHFHTFLRPGGMPPEAAPSLIPTGMGPEDALSHLVAITMDRAGRAIGLFATNRWVTGEAWYPGPVVGGMLDGFAVDLARPSWPTNRWISAMVRLFRPQIHALLEARDVVIDQHAAARPLAEVLEDRRLEVLAQVAIDVEAQRLAIEQERRMRRRAARARLSGGIAAEDPEAGR
ncbi:MAG: hypothetical protein RID91_12140 [Azospirillaceae bacterium]